MYLIYNLDTPIISFTTYILSMYFTTYYINTYSMYQLHIRIMNLFTYKVFIIKFVFCVSRPKCLKVPKPGLPPRHRPWLVSLIFKLFIIEIYICMYYRLKYCTIIIYLYFRCYITVSTKHYVFIMLFFW